MWFSELPPAVLGIMLPNDCFQGPGTGDLDALLKLGREETEKSDGDEKSDS